MLIPYSCEQCFRILQALTAGDSRTWYHWKVLQRVCFCIFFTVFLRQEAVIRDADSTRVGSEVVFTKVLRPAAVVLLVVVLSRSFWYFTAGSSGTIRDIYNTRASGAFVCYSFTVALMLLMVLSYLYCFTTGIRCT